MRRLPVIQDSTSDDAVAARRPRYQWIAIGAGLVVTLWTPVVVLVGPLGLRVAVRLLGLHLSDVTSGTATLTPRQATTLAIGAALPLVVAFGAAAWAGGALIGRFGGETARSDATFAALGAAVAVCLIAAFGGAGLFAPGILGVFVALAGAAVPLGRMGAAFGARRKAVLDSPR